MTKSLPVILEVHDSIDYPLDSIVNVPATIAAELIEDNDSVVASIKSNPSGLFYDTLITCPPPVHVATSATHLTFDQPQIDIPIPPAANDTNQTISHPLSFSLVKMVEQHQEVLVQDCHNKYGRLKDDVC